MKKPEIQDICNKLIFSAFFKAQAQTLRNYIYYKFGDKDFTQDAFIKLWQHCAEVRNPKSFVYTVAKNNALNHTAYKKVVFNYAANNASTALDNQNPEYLLEEKEFRHKFDAAIAALTESQRTALLLNRVEGKKYKEIAEMLGISVKAVEKRIHGALIAMSEKIENFR